MKLNRKIYLQCGITVIIVFLVIHYWDFFSHLLLAAAGAVAPLLIGAAIAYIINILMTFFERHFAVKSKSKVLNKIRRPCCIVLSFIALTLIAGVVCFAVIPELAACLKMMFEQLPSAINSIYSWLNEKFDLDALFSNLEFMPEDISDWKSILEKAADVAVKGVGNVMGSVVSVVSSVFSAVVTLALAIIFSIYALFNKEKLQRQCKTLLGTYTNEKVEEKTMYVLQTVNSSFHSYIVGQCTEAVILGLLCMLGMLLLRLPYAVMIGCLVGFTAFIPVAGAYIGAVIGALMIFSVSPVKALIFLVFLILLQQFEGNVIYPRVVGNSVGLPSMWVLAAITVGGGLGGIFGILLSVPIAASVYKFVCADVKKRKDKKREQDAACQD